ncbi:hypothetical protein BDY21DRAFT_177840 [Lineolata rhizophorae]|uniref:Uncharacterized protein n=1 Tax=Lineolata rhizophorae TaxID=578093 RepID=A0A6A6P7P3_9PEZI|nr:hypothetical protein BDY21DRAFT_177840 [Lineolata rhizophorae]
MGSLFFSSIWVVVGRGFFAGTGCFVFFFPKLFCTAGNLEGGGFPDWSSIFCSMSALLRSPAPVATKPPSHPCYYQPASLRMSSLFFPLHVHTLVFFFFWRPSLVGLYRHSSL